MKEVFACNLDAMNSGQRKTYHNLISRLFAVNRGRTEIPAGFVFEFPVEELLPVAEFVSLERLCCPFIAFHLDVQPNSNSLSLRLTGSDGVKEFLQYELRFPGLRP